MSKFIALASRLAIVAVPLALAGIGAPAAAEQTGPAKDPQLAQSQVGGYSQEQLESYVAAVKQVQRVDEAWQPRMTEAETPEEIESMTRQATDEMIGEIENQGLTVTDSKAPRPQWRPRRQPAGRHRHDGGRSAKAATRFRSRLRRQRRALLAMW